MLVGLLWSRITPVVAERAELAGREENSNVMKPAADTDEDDWSAVPAFLRRSKNR
jgi:hypothetical protein